MKKFLLALFLFCSFAFAQEKAIGVSIAPYKKIISEICGPDYNVFVFVPTAQDPHAFEPTPSQMQQFAKCDVWFLTNEPFEKKVEQKLQIKTIHLNQDHDNHDFLSCKQLILKVKTITEQVCTLYPEDEALFKQNEKKLLEKLDVLDQKFEKTETKTILTQHDCFTSLCSDYHKTQLAIEKHGKEPTFLYLSDLIKKAQKQNVKRIFVEPQYSKKQAQFLANKLDLDLFEINIYQEDVFETLNLLVEGLQDD